MGAQGTLGLGSLVTVHDRIRHEVVKYCKYTQTVRVNPIKYAECGKLDRTVFSQFVGIVVDHGLLSSGSRHGRRNVERSSHEYGERGKQAETRKS